MEVEGYTTVGKECSVKKGKIVNTEKLQMDMKQHSAPNKSNCFIPCFHSNKRLNTFRYFQ